MAANMSFYEAQGWQPPARQASWEQPPPPSRSGASSTSQRDDTSAFGTQFDEVDRAIDNLVKSGKFYPQGPRRDSMPSSYGGGAPNRNFDHGPRHHGGGRHSVSNINSPRPRSASNMQNYYASQRHQGGRAEGDPMMQAKRRMAAQRERELRNYHQEQQYNRSVLAEMSSNKSERSMSPSTLSEEGRRELIARQHRALYGGEGVGFNGSPGAHGDESTMTSSTTSAARGTSPRGLDPFGGPSKADGVAGGTADRSTSSPTSQQPTDHPHSPPAGDDAAHARHIAKSTTAPLSGNMGPIGSRPSVQPPSIPSLNKQTTSPLPSTRGYGFGANDGSNERSGSSNSNANQKDNKNSSMSTWGSGSGVWGSGKIGTTSVWG